LRVVGFVGFVEFVRFGALNEPANLTNLRTNFSSSS